MSKAWFVVLLMLFGTSASAEEQKPSNTILCGTALSSQAYDAFDELSALVRDGSIARVLPNKSDQLLDQLIRAYFEKLKATDQSDSWAYSYDELYNYVEQDRPINTHLVASRSQSRAPTYRVVHEDRIQIYRLDSSLHVHDVLKRLIYHGTHFKNEWSYSYSLSFASSLTMIAPLTSSHDLDAWVIGISGLAAGIGNALYTTFSAIPDERRDRTVKDHNNELLNSVRQFEAAARDSWSLISVSVSSQETKTTSGFDFLLRKRSEKQNPDVFMIPWVLDERANQRLGQIQQIARD